MTAPRQETSPNPNFTLAEQGPSKDDSTLSTHAAIYNTFNTQPHLISRPGLRTLRVIAHHEWTIATQAA